MRIEAHGGSDIGLRRPRNEDRFLMDHELGLYAVCDGMGGHVGGDVAAEAAIAGVAAYLRQHRQQLQQLSDDDAGQAAAKQLMGEAVQAAHRRVRSRAAETPGLRNMGTTLTMLLLLGHTGVVAHVGDSRLYRLRQGRSERLTNDHTLAGQLTSEQAAGLGHLLERYRHSLLRWIGSGNPPQPDLQLVSLRDGDCLLLCTDGLTNYPAAGDDLAHVVCEQSPEHAVQTLVQRARACGGRDNITAVVLQLRSEGASDASASTLIMDQDASPSPPPYCFNFR